MTAPPPAFAAALDVALEDVQPVDALLQSAAAGGSLSWQARRSSFAMSYSHAISSGGGLIS